MACLGRPSAALQPRNGSMVARHSAALTAGSSGGAASGRRGGAVVAAAGGGRRGGRVQVRPAQSFAWHACWCVFTVQLRCATLRTPISCLAPPSSFPVLLQLRVAAHPLAARASSSSSSGSGSGGSTGEAAAPRKKPGPPPSPVPDVDAEQLLHSLGLSSTADPATLLRSLRKLKGVRQQGVLDNAAAVAAHLLSPAVGLTAQQVGQLLECCPALFSWPPEQRAAVLFGQLLGAGLTAADAAQCFAVFPKTAEYTALAPGLAEAAAILAHSQDRQEGQGMRAAVPAAQRTVAALLSRIPSAVQMVCNTAGYVQQRAAELQQAGFTPAQVAELVWRRPELLHRNAAAKMDSKAAVLQQELGLTAAQLVSLVASRQPQWLTCTVSTLQERAAALVEVRDLMSVRTWPIMQRDFLPLHRAPARGCRAVGWLLRCVCLVWSAARHIYPRQPVYFCSHQSRALAGPTRQSCCRKTSPCSAATPPCGGATCATWQPAACPTPRQC